VRRRNALVGLRVHRRTAPKGLTRAAEFVRAVPLQRRDDFSDPPTLPSSPARTMMYLAQFVGPSTRGLFPARAGPRLRDTDRRATLDMCSLYAELERKIIRGRYLRFLDSSLL